MSTTATTLDAAQLRGIIERDRQQFLGLVETLRREVESRRYLADEGIARSPLDTDLHRTDFGEAVTAMLRKLDHARTVVTCWPIGESVQLLAEGDLCSLNPECPYYGPPPCPHPPPTNPDTQATINPVHRPASTLEPQLPPNRDVHEGRAEP